MGEVPVLPLPGPTQSCPPILSLFPRWRRKIFYFLLFITSDLGPLFFPINLSVLCERPTDRCLKDFYFLLHKKILKNK